MRSFRSWANRVSTIPKLVLVGYMDELGMGRQCMIELLGIRSQAWTCRVGQTRSLEWSCRRVRTFGRV